MGLRSRPAHDAGEKLEAFVNPSNLEEHETKKRITTVKHNRSLRLRPVMTLFVAAGVALPLIPLAIAGGDTPNVFADGEIIYADDMNGNFDDVDGRLDVYEDAISVDADGNVGIGTTSPDE